MSERIMKALANCEQGLTEEQKLQARTNIGAIAGVRVQDTSGTTDLVPDEQGRVTVDLTNAGKVQSDWDETNDAEPSYIRNKPDLLQFATKDELDGKQDVLEAGDNIIIEGNTISATAEPQQQADWAQTDTEAVDYIKNKPTIPAAQVQSDWSQSDSSAVDYIKNKPNLATVATSGSYDDLSDKPTIPPAQVQSDWAQTNTSAVDYIKNKPSIPAAQVQSDWNQSNSSAVDYIKNKPNLATVATSGSYNDLSDKPSIPGQQQADWAQTNSSAVDYIKNKPNLASVATSGNYNDLSNKPTIPPAQVQSDWNESDSSSKAYIQNKPSIPAAQVQSDWAQTDSSSVDYIKNKPSAMETKPLVAGTNIEFDSNAQRVQINSTAAKISKSSSPYTSPVDLSGVTVFDPGEDFGSLVRDQGNNTLGYLAPKHYGNSDVGKVLTVVSDGGYKMEWKQPSGGTMELKPLTMATQNLTSSNPVTLTIADGYAYELVMQDSLSASVTLATNSEGTIHSLVYVKNNGGTHCGTVTLVWRDAALEQHTVEIDMTETNYEYCFDVYIRKVTINSEDYAIAIVNDYPVAYRESLYSFSTNNKTTEMVGVWLH